MARQLREQFSAASRQKTPRFPSSGLGGGRGVGSEAFTCRSAALDRFELGEIVRTLVNKSSQHHASCIAGRDGEVLKEICRRRIEMRGRGQTRSSSIATRTHGL